MLLFCAPRVLISPSHLTHNLIVASPNVADDRVLSEALLPDQDDSEGRTSSSTSLPLRVQDEFWKSEPDSLVPKCSNVFGRTKEPKLSKGR